MEQDPNQSHEISTSVTKVTNENLDGSADKSRTSRHSRWTRHETLVLIEAKKAAEQRVGKGRRSGSGHGLDPHEPKWDSVSSYCKQRGVDRGPVQCRKRWSNLAGDFKRIKTWEEMESSVQAEKESFWMMKNESKKENRLPGFFDKEVFDVMSGGRAYNAPVNPLAMVNANSQPNDEEDEVFVMDEDDEFGDEALIFDYEQHSVQEEKMKIPEKDTTVHSPIPISENRYHPVHLVSVNPGYEQRKHPVSQLGYEQRKHPVSQIWPGSTSNEGGKKRRYTTNEAKDVNFEERLINVLERNAAMMALQIESQNKNLQLDRVQRKDQVDNLVAALKKATDAMVRIADKLTKDK